MFSLLPKTRRAADKARRLTALEVALIDMDMTAAFGQPDANLRLLDVAETTISGRHYEVFVIELETIIVSLVFADNGRVGIADFCVTNLHTYAPSLSM